MSSWELADMAYTGKSRQLITQTSDPSHMVVKDDGTRLWVGRQSDPDIHQYNLSVPWDITSRLFDTTFNFLGFGGIDGLDGFMWNNDGTRLAIGSVASSEIYWWTVPTAYDVGSIVGLVKDTNYIIVRGKSFPHPPYFDQSSQDGLTWSGDGYAYFVRNAGEPSVPTDVGWSQWGVVVPYDLSQYNPSSNDNTDFKGSFRPSPMPPGVTGPGNRIAWGDQGFRAYIVHSNSLLVEYEVELPWDLLSTVTWKTVYDFSIEGIVTALRDIAISPDGNTMFVLDDHVNSFYSIFEYSLGGNPVIGGLATYIAGDQCGTAEDQISTVAQPDQLDTTAQTCQGDGLGDACTSASEVVTLVNQAGSVNVGYPYVSDLETLDVESRAGASVFGEQVTVSKVTITVDKTVGMLVGPNRERLVSMDDLQFVNDRGVPIGWDDRTMTGKTELAIPSEWNSNGRIFIRQKEPQPLTVLSITPDTGIGDDGD